MTLPMIYEDETFSVAIQGDPAVGRVILCFTGIGLQLGQIQPAEFVGTAAMPDTFALHITDKERTWYNGIDHAKLAGVLNPLVRGKSVVTLGNSMGGFGAIWISSVLVVDTVIAFAPQFSVHPDVVPNETRWSNYRDRISTWQVPNLAGSFRDRTSYYTINGLIDRDHWRRFPRRDNCQHIVLSKGGHGVAATLKEAGTLKELIVECVNNGDAAALLSDHKIKHRVLRKANAGAGHLDRHSSTMTARRLRSFTAPPPAER